MIQKTTLANGLRIATQKIPSVATSVGVFVGTGAIYENKDEYGLSHFLEHMAFKGTEIRSSEDIAEAIEYAGGSSNAYTSYGHTCYYASVLNNEVKSTIDIILDSTINSVFPEKEIEIERGVIKQEIAMYQDRPGSLVFYNLHRALYGDVALGGNIIGTSESLDTFSKSSFIDYVNKWYTINNIILVVTGDVEHSEIVDYVQNLTHNEKPKPVESYCNMPIIGGHSIYNKNFEQVNLIMALPGFSYSDYKKAQAMDLLSSYLGSGMSSPLFKEVREKRGLVYSIHADSSSFRDSGYLSISAGTTPENVDEILDLSLSELEKILTHFDERNFIRAKNQSKMLIGKIQESTGSTMRYIGGNWLADESLLYDFDDLINHINEVTEQDIKDTVTYLLGQKPSISAVGPVTEKTRSKIEEMTK